MIGLSGVSVSYGKRVALRGIDADLPTGVTALVGANGAGKTTLLKVLAGVIRPQTGGLTKDGQALGTRELRRLHASTGYLPQRPSWHGWMRVSETAEFFAWLHGSPRAETRARAFAALEVVALSDEQDTPVANLSGGQLQRLMLATCLVHDPEVLVLDEPSVGLDPAQRLRLRETVRRIAESRAVVVSTHLMDDVAATADAVVILDRGAVVFSGTPCLLAGVAEGGSPTPADLEAAYVRCVEGTARDAS